MSEIEEDPELESSADEDDEDEDEESSGSGKPGFTPGGKTTPADREAIRNSVAEGEMRPSECAVKYGVSIQYISKILRKAGIRYGSRKEERERAAAAAVSAKEAELKASFAERRLKFIEEHKMSAYAQLRGAFMMEGVRQQKWRETVRAGGGPPAVKEANVSARTMAVLDERIRELLGIDDLIDEKELPQIDIRYMGDDEIIAARKGQEINEDDLTKLDDDVVEESS